MITESERESLTHIETQDFYAPLMFLCLSRYDRLKAEAAQFDKVLGPADFVAIVNEAYQDLEEG